MKHSKIELQLAIFIIAFLFTYGCDPMPFVKYKVTLPKAEHHSANKLDIKIDTGSISTAIGLIDESAKKNGMIKKDDARFHEQIDHYYVGEYETHGLTSTSRKIVDLRVIVNEESNIVSLQITDYYRFTRSDLSEKLENDIINAMKKQFGEKAVNKM